MHVPFNIPFDNQRYFHALLPPDFDQRRVFKGQYAEKVRRFFLEQFHCPEAVLTSSCTHALELAALLLDIQSGDEVIVPAYTYVSTAAAFDRAGARVVFCDSAPDSPNIDLGHLESLINPATKAVVIVHYGGACTDMDSLLAIVRQHQLILIEDAAHALGANYNGRPLGAFGDFSAFSFHETKNLSCGQGGALLINNPAFAARARTLRDCGTNRHDFETGIADAYTWVDTGSVFNLSELNCAYLAPQLDMLEKITEKRRQLWNEYYNQLLPLQARGLLRLPVIHPLCRHNAHIFYIVLSSQAERNALIACMKEQDIAAAFHYSPLHLSPYYLKNHAAVSLPMAERFAACLLRLPLYYDLEPEQQDRVIRSLYDFFDFDQTTNS